MVKESEINVDLDGDNSKDGTVEMPVAFFRKNLISTKEIKGEISTK